MPVLTNEDFRRFLLNSADASVLEAGGKANKKRKKEYDPKKAKRRDRYAKQNVVTGKSKENQKVQIKQTHDEDDTTSHYRDRAQERRKGKIEYVQVVSEMRDIKNRSVEESKFLGGDVEHTHLVKGLDFALLTKVRLEHQEPREKKVSEETSKQQKQKSFKLPWAHRLYQKLLASIHPHHIHFGERVARVESTILAGATFKGNTEKFLPQRMTYGFDAQYQLVGCDVPTVLFASPEDCDAPAEGLVLQCTSSIREALQKAVLFQIENRKRNKQNRWGRRETDGALYLKSRFIASAPTDEDIFEVTEPTQHEEDEPTNRTASDVIRDGEIMEVDDVNASIAVSSQADFQMKYEAYQLELEKECEKTQADSTNEVATPIIPMTKKPKRRIDNHNNNNPGSFGEDYVECYPDYGERDVSEEALLGKRSSNKKKRKAFPAAPR